MAPISDETDVITPELAVSLPGLFLERVRHSGERCAYIRCKDEGRDTVRWHTFASMAGRWQQALRQEGLKPGDRVALMLGNGFDWVLFDLAALGLGLVTVPLYANDRAENVAPILEETGARLLLIDGDAQWRRLRPILPRLNQLTRVVALHPVVDGEPETRPIELEHWLTDAGADYEAGVTDPDQLATIVYTSGTTGRPKGVMLSHRNILANAHACLLQVPVHPDDLFLSMLPLSHALERTIGCYLPMMAGATVAYGRSPDKLAEDLVAVRPTIIVSVPRIFERAYKRAMAQVEQVPPWKRRLFRLTLMIGERRFRHRQGGARRSVLLPLWPLLERLVAAPVRSLFGDRLRLAISGGAPLHPQIARFFLALDLTLLQGYGLTETAPVISVNTPQQNRPESVGHPLPGVRVRLGDDDELLVRGPNVMAGYWQNPQATAQTIDADGWLHTGDQARIDTDGNITISGRLKEIIVLANGEKLPSADVEMAIASDPLFEQVLVVGEGRPYLAALVVLEPTESERMQLVRQTDADRERLLLDRIGQRMARFPGYGQIRRVAIIPQRWEFGEGLLTATLKNRRDRLLGRFSAEIERLYEGH